MGKSPIAARVAKDPQCVLKIPHWVTGVLPSHPMDNHAMQRLRHARFLARLVLVWFALAIGAAIASPIVKPQALDLVCSSVGGIKLVVTGDDGTVAPAGHVLDCPMCTPTGAPPPAAGFPGPTAQPLSRAVQSIPAARIAALTAAPLPARGPPSSLAIR